MLCQAVVERIHKNHERLPEAKGLSRDPSKLLQAMVETTGRSSTESSEETPGINVDRWTHRLSEQDGRCGRSTDCSDDGGCNGTSAWNEYSDDHGWYQDEQRQAQQYNRRLPNRSPSSPQRREPMPPDAAFDFETTPQCALDDETGPCCPKKIFECFFVIFVGSSRLGGE